MGRDTLRRVRGEGPNGPPSPPAPDTLAGRNVREERQRRKERPEGKPPCPFLRTASDERTVLQGYAFE